MAEPLTQQLWEVLGGLVEETDAEAVLEAMPPADAKVAREISALPALLQVEGGA